MEKIIDIDVLNLIFQPSIGCEVVTYKKVSIFNEMWFKRSI